MVADLVICTLPSPTECRGPLTLDKLFPIALFEPSKAKIAEATGTKVEGNDDGAAFEKEVADLMNKKGLKGSKISKGKKGSHKRKSASKGKQKREVASDTESSAEGDRADEKKPAPRRSRAAKTRAAKKSIILTSVRVSADPRFGSLLLQLFD